MGRRKKAQKSHIGIVLDRSGSMQSIALETKQGFDQMIERLREEAGGDTYVTLVQFDTEIETVFEQLLINSVDELVFVPRGMTALLDGVGEAIRRMEKFVRSGDNVAITIMTDGGENSSHEFTKDSVTKLMDEKREDGWEFNFLGAGPAAWGGASLLGISHTHVINYSGDAHDHSVAFAAAALSNVAKTRGMSSSYVESTPLLKSQLESKAQSDIRLPEDYSAIRPSGRRIRKRS